MTTTEFTSASASGADQEDENLEAVMAIVENAFSTRKAAAVLYSNRETVRLRAKAWLEAQKKRRGLAPANIGGGNPVLESSG